MRLEERGEARAARGVSRPSYTKPSHPHHSLIYPGMLIERLLAVTLQMMNFVLKTMNFAGTRTPLSGWILGGSQRTGWLSRAAAAGEAVAGGAWSESSSC